MKGMIIPALLILLVATAPAFAQVDTTAPVLPNPQVLPDSPIYGFKTLLENIHLMTLTNDTLKAKYEVQLAQTRLAEMQKELQKGDTVHAQQAQTAHDQEVNDAETIANRQGNDNHGQQVSAYVHSLLADHQQNIGKLVSKFAQNGTTNQLTVLQNVQTSTANIRQNHGDNAQPSTNISSGGSGSTMGGGPYYGSGNSGSGNYGSGNSGR